MDFISDESGALIGGLYSCDEGDPPSFPGRAANAGGLGQSVSRRPTDKSGTGDTTSLARGLGVLLSGRDIPFAFYPEIVHFADFRVGRPQTIAVKFVNRSLRSALFRVLPVSPLYADELSVCHTAPPPISPGLSWTVTVRFAPRKHKAIATELAIRTEGGYFYVPITTSAESTSIRVTPDALDFGSVPIGTPVERVMTVVNEGAKQGTVLLTGNAMQLLRTTRTDPHSGETTPPLLMRPSSDRFVVAPHSSLRITLTFRAFEVMEMDHRLFIDEPTSKEGIHAAVAIRGFATDVPVFLATSEVDFNECFYGSTYTAAFKVANTSEVSVLVSPQFTTRDLSGHIRVEPRELRVQAHDEFVAALIFAPSPELESNFHKTLRFLVPGQTISPVLHVRARLSQRELEVDTTDIMFDEASAREEQVRVVQVHNPSRVCQHVHFVDLPSNATVVPDFLTMLPDESAKFRLCIIPVRAGVSTFVCGVVNGHGDRVDLRVVVRARAAHVEFSEATVWLPRCAIGSNVSASVLMTNNSSSVCRFAFSVPHPCLSVAPNMGYLDPYSTTSLALFFAPRNCGEASRLRAAATAVEPSLHAISQASRRPRRESQSSLDKEVVAHCAGESLRDNYDELPRQHSSSWKEANSELRWLRHDVYVVRCVCEQVDKRGIVHAMLGTQLDQAAAVSTLVVHCTSVQPTLLGRYIKVRASFTDNLIDRGGAKAVEAVRGKSHRERTATPRRAPTMDGGEAHTLQRKGREVGKKVPTTVEAASVELETASTRQDLALASDASPIVLVDFGDVSFRSESTRVVCIRNNRGAKTHIRVRPLNPLSPFQLLRYPERMLQPGEEDAFTIQFRPTSVGTFMSECIVSGSSNDHGYDTNDVCFILRGKCFCSRLLVLRNRGEDEDSESTNVGDSFTSSVSTLDLPVVQLGKSVRAVVYLFNAGEHAVHAQTFVGQASAPSSEWMSRHIILTYPDKFVIEPKKKVRCTVIFSPPLAGAYSGSICVKSGDLCLDVAVCGHCYTDAVYLTIPRLPERMSHMSCTSPHLYFDEEQQYFPNNVIHLSCAVGESKSLIVGSVMGGPSVEGSVVQMDQTSMPANWIIEPAVFSLTSGEKVNISVLHAARTVGMDEAALSDTSLSAGTAAVSPCLRFSVVLRYTLESVDERRYHVTCT